MQGLVEAVRQLLGLAARRVRHLDGGDDAGLGWPLRRMFSPLRVCLSPTLPPLWREGARDVSGDA
jgi:hypothetical protein